MFEKFSLKWNDFQYNVTKSFSNLRNEEDFCDVTLVSDDQKPISAHKVVLSSCSEYFKNILKQNKHSQPLLCLEGINSNELNNILDYIYYGYVNILQDDLDKFLRISQRLKLQGLMAEEDDSKSNITVPEEYVPPNIAFNDFKYEKVETSDILQVSESKINNEKTIIINNFQNIEDLDARIMEIIDRDADGFWKCTICGKKTRYKGHLKEHAEVHFEGLTFSCSDCDYVCRSRNALRLHAYKHKK